jgi:hypothetical protein
MLRPVETKWVSSLVSSSECPRFKCRLGDSVCWPIFGVLADPRCADRYSVCWPRFGVLTDTLCADRHSVRWLILGALTDIQCADWYSVYWRTLGVLILGVLTDIRCADWYSVYWRILGVLILSVLTDTRCAERYSVCWLIVSVLTKTDFLTETRCVQTDVLPMARRADWDRLFWLRLYIRLSIRPGKLQRTTANSATTMDAVSKTQSSSFAPLRFFLKICLPMFSNLPNHTTKR